MLILLIFPKLYLNLLYIPASYQLTMQPESSDGFCENKHVSIPLFLGAHVGGYVGISGEGNHIYFENLAYPQCSTTLHPPEWLNKRDNIKQMLQSLGQMEFSFTTDESIN